MNGKENKTSYTILDYLPAKVKFGIPRKAMLAILTDRDIDPATEMSNDVRDADNTRLAYADMLRWFVIGQSKKTNTSDTDNGWTHSGGGYELDEDDKRRLIREANAIYEKLEPESVIKSKSTFRMMSFGVQHANYDISGNPLPHIIR